MGLIRLEKTEKLHILVVLENDSPTSIDRIRVKLEEDLHLTPKLDALWKSLQRCRRQGLVEVEKIGRRNLYRITENGKKRRMIIAAKREREFKDWINGFFRNSQPKEAQNQQEKPNRDALNKRAVEVELSLRLCKALKSCNCEPSTLQIAEFAEIYWESEKLDLYPYLVEEAVKIIDEVSRRYAKSIERMPK
jgi:DNA-binding PadR family transcriptional regulator